MKDVYSNQHKLMMDNNPKHTSNKGEHSYKLTQSIGGKHQPNHLILIYNYNNAQGYYDKYTLQLHIIINGVIFCTQGGTEKSLLEGEKRKEKGEI